MTNANTIASATFWTVLAFVLLWIPIEYTLVSFLNVVPIDVDPPNGIWERFIFALTHPMVPRNRGAFFAICVAAVLMGLLAGAINVWFSRKSFWVVLLLCVAVPTLPALVFVREWFVVLVALFALIHSVPILICWYFTRRLWKDALRT